MSLSQRRGFKLQFFVACAVLGLVVPVAAKPRQDEERSELMRQLNEFKQRVRALEERIRQLDSRKPAGGESSVAEAKASDGCGIPFFMDVSGVKRVRPECMGAAVPVSHQVSCAAPFEIGENGIKRVRDACSTEAAVIKSGE